ncbi:hypothetical protein OQA88_2998 [Cercophora sp. LCS_1]
MRGTDNSPPDIEQGLRDTTAGTVGESGDHGHATDDTVGMRKGLVPGDRPSSVASRESAQSTEGVYSLLPISLPAETDSTDQLVYIITIHDFDEKSSENWGYVDLRKVAELGKRKRLSVVGDLNKLQGRRSHENKRRSVEDPSKPVSGTDETAATSTSVYQVPEDDNKKEPRPETSDGAGHSAVDNASSKIPSRAPSFVEGVVGCRWLQDPNMLPKALPGARVLEFTYPTSNLRRLNDDKAAAMLDNFIEKTASELLERILKMGSKVSNVINTKIGELPPIIFVAAGFGGIIVQEALKMMVKKVEQATSAQVFKDDISNPENLVDVPAQSTAAVPDIRRVVGIVFLDTPFPKDGGALKDFPPTMAVLSPRATAIVKLMRKLEAKWNCQGINGIWTECWDALSRHKQPVRFAWLYPREPSSTTTNRAPTTTNVSSDSDSLGPALTLIRTPLDRLRRLPNFDGPDDPGYKSVIIHIRQSLTVRAASDPSLKHLLKMLLETGAPVNTKDETGVSILHLAAIAPNPEGTKWLLGRHADTRVRNSRSQTPLHCAIEMFCDEARCPDDDLALQECLKTVIGELLKFTNTSELRNSRDELGRTPRDLVRKCRCRVVSEAECRHSLIKNLLVGHRPTIKAGWEEEDEKPWRGWGRPRMGTPQHRACTRSRAFVAAFYSKTAEGPPIGLYEVPSVYDLIYNSQGGPAAIIAKAMEGLSGAESDPPACRWLHIPANNEQWVHDLFLRLRMKNSSMKGERHRGPYTSFLTFTLVGTTPWAQSVLIGFDQLTTTFSPPKGKANQQGLHVIREDLSDQESESGTQATIDIVDILQGDGEWHSKSDANGHHDHFGDAVVLFMPVLSFEEHGARKKMTEAIKSTLRQKGPPSPEESRRASTAASSEFNGWKEPWKKKRQKLDTSLVEGYLETDRPVHCRRTLDQYKYHMVKTTEERDGDQIVYKWARKQKERLRKGDPDSEGEAEHGGRELLSRWNPDMGSMWMQRRGHHTEPDKDKKLDKSKHWPIVMVDQLWLWILPDGTVITSLPNSADPSQDYNLKNQLEKALFDKPDPPIRSVDDLVTTILKTCVGFFDRDGPCDVRFQDCFQYTISDIAEAEIKMYKKYKKAVGSIEPTKPGAVSSSDQSSEVFSQITEETNHLVEIMDVQDELEIVKTVLNAQKDVLQKLISKHMPRWATSQKTDASRVPEAIHMVEENKASVQEMMTSARGVQEDLKQLLEFKQQQSSAWEMRYSMKLARQGQRQNSVRLNHSRPIMLVFTIVTIVFLPLSFMTSFLALGVDEFPKIDGETSWPLSRLCAYLSFHVKRLTKMTKTVRARKDPSSNTDRPPNRDTNDNSSSSSSGSESDSDSSSDSTSTTAARRSLYRNRVMQRSDTSINTEGGNYAPLFGRYAFHKKIPLVRKLWKYHVYRVHMLGDVDTCFEDFGWDYPLQRFRKRVRVPIEKMLLAVGMRRLSEFYRGYELKNIQREYDEYGKEVKEFMTMREVERIAAHLRSSTRSPLEEKKEPDEGNDEPGQEVARTNTKDFETGQERIEVFRRAFSGRRERSMDMSQDRTSPDRTSPDPSLYPPY